MPRTAQQESVGAGIQPETPPCGHEVLFRIILLPPTYSVLHPLVDLTVWVGGSQDTH